MADTAKRLAGPVSVPSVTTVLYTVPAATQAIIRNIHIANTSGNAAVFRMSIGADAAGTRLLSDVSIPGNSVYDWSGFIVLDTGEVLRNQSGTNNVLTITISGVEVT